MRSICPRVANKIALKRATVAKGAPMPLNRPRMPSDASVCSNKRQIMHTFYETIFIIMAGLCVGTSVSTFLVASKAPEN